MEQESVDYNPIEQADFIEHLREAGFADIEADGGFYIARAENGRTRPSFKDLQ